MSYYSILPSQRAGLPPGQVTTTGQNPDPMRPLQTPDGGFRTRDVQSGELVQNQLNDITSADGRYIQRARNRAGASANASGLAHSSLAMGAGEAAAIDAALPIAQQDAGTNYNVNTGNMDAENEYLNQRAALQNAAQIAQNNNGTSWNIAQLNDARDQRQLDEDTRRYDQGFLESGRRYDTDWERQQQETATANTNARNNYIAGRIIDTTMSDPSLWRDGPGALGFANYYGSGFGDIWASLFDNP